MVESYDYLAELRIRKIPPPENEPMETYDKRITEWVLCSMGMDEVELRGVRNE